MSFKSILYGQVQFILMLPPDFEFRSLGLGRNPRKWEEHNFLLNVFRLQKRYLPHLLLLLHLYAIYNNQLPDSPYFSISKIHQNLEIFG